MLTTRNVLALYQGTEFTLFLHACALCWRIVQGSMHSKKSCLPVAVNFLVSCSAACFALFTDVL